jgi:hypothetical protein
MKTGRAFETVTKLKDGRVLIVGGLATDAIDADSVLGSAEIYNPATGTTTLVAGSLITPRYRHFAALLADGRVLIAGGRNAVDGVVRAAELFNPATGTFTAAGNTPFIDYEPCNATTLTDGRVLFAGGWSIGSFSVNRAVIYNPVGGTFTDIPMTQQHCTSATVLLPSGKVLIVGGMLKNASGDKPTTVAELFNPTTGTFGPTGSMTTPRVGLTATLISTTRVLVTGGKTSWSLGTPALATAELYNIDTGWFGSTGSMASKRVSHTATLLASGKVLVTGGVVDIPIKPCPADTPAELYDPATGHFTNTAKTALCRSGHAAVLLNSGRVLLVGGGPMVYPNQDRTMELYWP